MVNFFDLPTNKLLNIADNIVEIAHRIESEQKIFKAEPTRPMDNPKIAKKVMDYIAAGYSPDNACILTAADMDETFARVRAVYDENRIGTAAVRFAEKRFFCRTLRQKGFKIREIADALDVSAVTVYKYLE